MERFATQELIKWKEKESRKPLILRGARQVGKTWLMKEFGKAHYNKTVYVNFENSKLLQTIFSEDYDIQRIITALQIETGVQIDAKDTLIIFDEIQDAKGAVTSLKYFFENAPEYHVIAAGSLLGVALHEKVSFPVGKVEFLNISPLNYAEFLLANNQTELYNLLESNDWNLINGFKSKYVSYLRQYYFIGGMPEVVQSFVDNNDFNDVRNIQNRILLSYEHDFSKHAPYEIVPRIRMLWNSLPAQLSKENKKFIYRIVKSGARAKNYEIALSWLIDSGLAGKVCKVSKPGFPLKAYEDYNAFKLFIVDVGLLGAMVGIDAATLLNGNVIFEEFKGALTEQFIFQELKTIDDIAIYYWSAEHSAAEVDFVVQYAGKIFPIEVKAEENLQAKSLKVFFKKHPHTIAIRTSMSNYREDGWLTNFPLFAIKKLTEIKPEIQ